MKIFSTEHLFQYPWDRVSIANWIKYPNDLTPHVIHVDYLARRLDPSTGILHTERLLTCRQNVPAFISRILGGEDSSLFYEVSEVDRQGRTLTLRSRNITFCHLLTVEETCRYMQTDEGNTLLRQEVAIHSAGISGNNTSGLWKGLANRIEEWVVGRFHSNAQKGRMALESALERVYKEAKEQVRDAIQFFDPNNNTDSDNRKSGGDSLLVIPILPIASVVDNNTINTPH